jgi:predicted enzyme related to lactoylglutathione lyase
VCQTNSVTHRSGIVDVSARTLTAMGARRVAIVIDADDVVAVRDFWVEALGYVAFGSAGQYRSAIPADGADGPKFVFQQVGERRPAGKNRLHVDIEVGDDMEAECARLVGIGATQLGEPVAEAGTVWIVMADPEGNEFCLVRH